MLAWLERRLGRYAIPRLWLVLILGQGITLVGSYLLGKDQGGKLLDRLLLDPIAVVERGEWWRLLSFPFCAPTTDLLVLLLAALGFWLVGRALEHGWGAFRFNVFIGIGWLSAIAVTFAAYLWSGQSDGWLQGSLFLGSTFLAFAWLFPDAVFYVLFVIPVKAKWLALFAWIGLGVLFVTGDVWLKLFVVSMVANFLAFFGGDLLRRLRRGGAGTAGTVRAALAEDVPFHRCAGCGATERSHPERRFRVCDECRPVADFCEVCLKTHAH